MHIAKSEREVDIIYAKFEACNIAGAKRSGLFRRSADLQQGSVPRARAAGSGPGRATGLLAERLRLLRQ